jgi:hypothetical protein
MQQQRKGWTWVALGVGLALSPLAASTFVAMDLDELVGASSAVVQGEVLRVESYWEKTGTVIVSEAMVRVEEAVLGDPHSIVRVRTFGGTVGDYTVEATGFPTFVQGERVLVFLEPDSEPDTLRVTGYQQGLYRIARAPGGGERALSALDAGSNLVSPDGRAADLPRELSLAELKERIRAARPAAPAEPGR